MFARTIAPGFFDAIVGACRAAGFGLNVVHEVENISTACSLVAAGLGVCFVPTGMQSDRSKAIVLRPLTPQLPRVGCELVLAYRRERLCDLVDAFVRVAHDART